MIVTQAARDEKGAGWPGRAMMVSGPAWDSSTCSAAAPPASASGTRRPTSRSRTRAAAPCGWATTAAGRRSSSTSSFRDQYQDFQDAGAEVIGVSSDAEASHEKFAAKHRLPFVLLADRSGVVRKQYGVPATLGLLPGRVTFVIDRQGIVRHVFNSQLQATRHVEEAIAALRALAGA